MDIDNSDEYLMEIASLVLDPTTQAPIVVLKDVKGETYLPIWIGVAEAGSIAAALRGLPSMRPLSHDLMNSMISELGGTIRRVVIDKLENSTYFAVIELCHADVVRLVDCRPSDAIALALRVAAPIVVRRQVVEEAHAQVDIEQGREENTVANLAEENLSEEGPQQHKEKNHLDDIGLPKDYEERDLSLVDREKWAELLSEMSPEDFKYKM